MSSCIYKNMSSAQQLTEIMPLLKGLQRSGKQQMQDTLLWQLCNYKLWAPNENLLPNPLAQTQTRCFSALENVYTNVPSDRML